MLERGLIVVEMFSDALLEIFPRPRLADMERRGNLLELCFLLGLEGARVHGRCHRVRVDNGGLREGQYEPNQQIASTRGT